ncbi:hypothetical protein JQ581_18295 [Bradyrhizobium liaoningense]|uniref:hypothetical protein n=1 Tax=Bradyrhizobium liaoningense TaxID=43992 RepID=UPI001BA85762|nr:hypothetical protein [Bradyrhizobium liaoningense]MBR0738889.1 hypothetical protein [Bradyrhizobium liaoningense]
MTYELHSRMSNVRGPLRVKSGGQSISRAASGFRQIADVATALVVFSLEPDADILWLAANTLNLG